jgi:hypothetical protein
VIDGPFPLLRCSAGEVPLGLAAAEVLEFLPPEAGVPHIATLLGVEAAPPEQSSRTLRLASAAGPVRINVDGPVRVQRLGSTSLLPFPTLLRGVPIRPVIGFLHEEGQVVLLLDVAGVVERVRESAPAGSKGGGP